MLPLPCAVTFAKAAPATPQWHMASHGLQGFPSMIAHEKAGPVIVETVTGLRAQVAAWRAAGERIALVPTMGALHRGHIALVERARREAERVVVSIFVNPAQFAPNEDFTRYPRTFDADVAALAAARADLVYAPSAETMYPEGFSTTVLPEGPAKAGLEDRFRPTHFAGVATVVAKLFVQSGADVAIFGEKDYQQLQVVTRMAQDLDLPIRVLGETTVREQDGLALSSRNRYLTPGERKVAPVLHAVMQEAASAIRSGTAIGAAAAQALHRIEMAGFAPDYLEVRDAVSLAPVAARSDAPLRMLVAAKLGTTRLIDNIPV